jgi:hypothetical protein
MSSPKKAKKCSVFLSYIIHNGCETTRLKKTNEPVEIPAGLGDSGEIPVECQN